MFSCKACSPSDPATATVKVNPTLLDGANKENVNSQQSIAEKEKQQREREARERKDKEEEERRQARAQEQEKREAARKAAEQRRQQEQEEWERRRAAEALQEQRRREEEEQRQEEARRREQEQREQEKRQQEKREQEQKAADTEKLQAFLTSKGYGQDVNGKRKTLRKHFFPLHDAIAAGDADLVRLLLAAGADPTLQSSSGKTPLDRAEKWNKDGSLDQVCELLKQALAERK